VNTPSISWVHVIVALIVIIVAMWLLHGFAHRR
jgi:hypothetical protein